MDGLRKQLHFVWEQQWDVTWRNYVHERFQHKNSPSDTRQRHLALDFGTVHDWVPIATLTELTPRLAKAYAAKTSKTLQRDLTEFTQQTLIERDGRKVRARRELIFAFLPLKKRG